MNELVVYLYGNRTGVLSRKDNGNLQFRYDPGYRGPVVSHALPLQADAHPHRLCLAVFGGLLAEGEARETLARNLGISRSNDFALLGQLGGDCAGAITLLQPGEQPPRQPAMRPIDEDDLDAIIGELPQRPLAADPRQGIRLSLAGAQPKLPLIIEERVMALPLNSAAATTHIIKPAPARFPGLVDNEAFVMELAGAVGLPVAATSKRTSAGGHPYLLVERFDRDLTTEPIRRLHQEDFCQALGRPAGEKYQAEGGPGVAEAVELLRAASSVPARDLPTLWRALAFNWLVGNCDAHAKNFSLLYDSSAPTLAPLYDLLSTTVYPALTTRLAMSIDGATHIEHVTPAAWDDLAGQVGFSRRFTRIATSEMAELTVTEAERLAREPRHANEAVGTILSGLRRRASI